MMTNTKNNDEQLSLTALDLEAIIESLIFVSCEPLTIEKIAEALESSAIGVHLADIRRALASLESKWSDESRLLGRGLCLKKLASGYAFLSTPNFAEVTGKLILEKPIELSKAHVEVLAIVAYRQPITRVDIDDIRGVDSSFALKKLMQLKLLKILGKSEGLGRPILYGTTKEFLEFFSLNSLNDLPTLKQYESLGADEAGHQGIEHSEVSFKDLFATKAAGIVSEEAERLSEDALKSLDEALARCSPDLSEYRLKVANS
jgi:segregation and condensation protein B